MGNLGDYRDRYAISTWHYVASPLEDALRGIAAAGFKWVEMWGDKAHLDPRIHPDMRAIGHLLGRLGLRVHSIHAPFSGLDLGLPGGARKADAQRVIGDALELGAALGATLAVIHVSSHGEDLQESARYCESGRVVEDLVHSLLQVAGRTGVGLALENLPPEANRRYFGCCLQELAAIFPDPSVGFCLDIGHAILHEVSIASEIQVAGSRLRSLHVHNNDGIHDRHWPPRQGIINWRATKAELARIGYEGAFVLEVDRGEDADAVVQELAEFAKYDVAA
jgi:sugar phosphate isomerase/epimerase